MANRKSVVSALKELKSYLASQSTKTIDFWEIDQCLNGQKNIDNAIELLDEQEARHGNWLTIWQEDDPYTSTYARCSVCNMVSKRPIGEYCKWCGAKMDNEVDNR